MSLRYFSATEKICYCSVDISVDVRIIAASNKKLSDEQTGRLTHACAVYAYYKYSLMNFASGVSRFKAGDVEITNAENITDTAHVMWQNEKKEIADIFDFDDFCFCRVSA